MPKIDLKDQQRICQYYGISPIDVWVKNPRGLVNLSFELDDRFFLTFHSRRTQDQLEAIGEIANNIGQDVPIARPVLGQEGYSLLVNNNFVMLTPRLPGDHYVGIAHTEKYPIPLNYHQSLASFFWQVQTRLSATNSDLKARLEFPSVTNIGDIPDLLPDVVQPLLKYSPEKDQPAFSYPDLIHDDLERQNILNVGNKVTGLTDLDSLRTGDVLYEFGHFMFNFVFCDPDAKPSTAAKYIDKLIIAGTINPRDISSLYDHIYQFTISDVIEFHNLHKKPTQKQHRLIDMDLLIHQYDKALSFASSFFRAEFH